MSQFAGQCGHCIYHEEEARQLRDLLGKMKYLWETSMVPNNFEGVAMIDMDNAMTMDKILMEKFPKVPKGGLK